MSEQSIVARTLIPANDVQVSPVAVNDTAAQQVEGTEDRRFEASLRYLAADLGEIARTAPPDKRSSLRSVMNLLRAIADS